MHPEDYKNCHLSEKILLFTEFLKSRLSSNVCKIDVSVELQYYRLYSKNSLDVCKSKMNSGPLWSNKGLNYFCLIIIDNQLLHEIDIKQIIRKFVH